MKVKISELPIATEKNNSIIPIVQSGVTKQLDINILQSGVASDLLIGQLFWDTNNNPINGKLFAGETYNWGDNPKLQTKFNAQGHDFIVDNGNGTFTIVSHSDFIRAGINNIGTHVDDTTAPNGLQVRYTRPNNPQPDMVGGGGNGVRFVQNNILASVTSTDSETAPDHRNAYFGIYGDLTELVVDTNNVPINNTGVSDGDVLTWNASNSRYEPNSVTTSTSNDIQVGVVPPPNNAGNGTDLKTVTFSSPFNSVPVVTATGFLSNGQGVLITINSVSATNFTYYAHRNDGIPFSNYAGLQWTAINV